MTSAETSAYVMYAMLALSCVVAAYISYRMLAPVTFRFIANRKLEPIIRVAAGAGASVLLFPFIYLLLLILMTLVGAAFGAPLFWGR